MNTKPSSGSTEPEPQTHHPRRGQSWSSFVDEQIREAEERGAFSQLEGAGKPLSLDVNPYAGDRALAYSLLKSHHMAPPEIELAREVEADLARAEALTDPLRRQHDQMQARRMAPFPSERRAYNLLRENVASRYVELLRAINSKILTLNIIAPAALHRQVIDVEGRMEAFHREFPVMTE